MLDGVFVVRVIRAAGEPHIRLAFDFALTHVLSARDGRSVGIFERDVSPENAA